MQAQTLEFKPQSYQNNNKKLNTPNFNSGSTKEESVFPALKELRVTVVVCKVLRWGASQRRGAYLACRKGCGYRRVPARVPAELARRSDSDRNRAVLR